MTPADVIALAEALRQKTDDDVTRAVLADALDEQGPGPVRQHELPGWLRLCWLRQTQKEQGWRRCTSSYGVLDEIVNHFGPDVMDHYGVGVVAGLECFVSEPYADALDAPDLFRHLAAALPGCAFAFARRGHWHPSTVRAILFPPLVMPPPKRGGRQKR